MADYDLFRGYLHSDDLRWSYGIVKGRDDDWSANVAREPVPQMVRGVKAAGFAGIYLDRFGYQDGGASIDPQLIAATGSTPFTSPDQRLFFYRLR